MHFPVHIYIFPQDQFLEEITKVKYINICSILLSKAQLLPKGLSMYTATSNVFTC